MITFACDKCGKQFTLKREFAGRTTSCSVCKAPLVVPAGAPPAHAGGSPNAGGSQRIAFSCEKCGMKFSVPAQCGGRKTTCPTCKNPLSVPPLAQLIQSPAAGRIDGTQSSLAKAGMEGGLTLAGDFTTAERLSLQNLIDSQAREGVRYVVEGELARGGMGAVMRAVDCDIRREVAVKYLLDQGDAKKKIRFVEEAQITGQLEHPNIVPIHELGVDAEKRIFFSMKMVKGRSLADILKALSEGEPGAVKGRVTQGQSGLLRRSPRPADEHSQGKLLNIFVNVCNALAYAHSRGVVHRDLKPANVMVGDFGEVYVMDWGLAKVLNRGMAATATGPVMAIPVARLATPEPFDFRAPAPIATPVTPAETTVAATGSGKIVTSRDSDADLTQDGAVLGTPMYMPPEQAAGKIDEIDERSDVYSMGAILYEILTLKPPVSKDGGYWAILMRVIQGQIDPPDQKAPERARAGKVPPELAAIAMKALARRKEDRYRSIEQLQGDIERFMDGRSVSAKQDTVRETAIKLVKRNMGASIATATAAVLLLALGIWSLVAILGANSRTQKAYEAYVAEQAEKREQAKKLVPSLVRAARLLIAEKQFDNALDQVNTAIGFDDKEPESRLVRAQLLIVRQDYAGAAIDLEACLLKQPKREDAKELLALVRDARKDDRTRLLLLAEEFGRQKVQPLAEQITQTVEKLMKSRQELVQVYQVRLEAVWPGYGRSLTLDGSGKYQLNFPATFYGVSSLEPLRGIPLSTLQLSSAPQVTDLTPLKGMPLAQLILASSPVSDLSPLRGAPLEYLNLSNCTRIGDLRPLKGMPIKTLNLNCSAGGNPFLSDLSPLEGMPLTSLHLQGCGKVTDLSPLKGAPLTNLELLGCQVTDLTPLKGMQFKTLSVGAAPNLRDLSPLRDMPLTDLTLIAPGVSDLRPLSGLKLTRLNIQNNPSLKDLAGLEGMLIGYLHFNNCQSLENISALQGMPLTYLELNACRVGDLSPLKGMKLTHFGANSALIKDLGPLEGMPLKNLYVYSCTSLRDLAPIRNSKLESLHIGQTEVADLEPIRGMPIVQLNADKSKLANLAPLAGMKLHNLSLIDCPVTDLSPLAGMPLTQLNLNGCKDLHDLTPLAGMKLNSVALPPNVTKGIGIIRSMKSLQTIDGIAPEQFWKLWDASKAKPK